MRVATGKPVRNADFFDRARELEELWHLVDRENVLMLAPRRVGKTSILLRMLDRSRPGWTPYFVPVQSVASEAELVARLIKQLHEAAPSRFRWKRLGKGIRSVLGDVRVGPLEVRLRDAVGDSWQAMGDELLRMLAAGKDRVLLLVDEFPIFVRRLLEQEDGEARARLLLDWFRGVRLDPDLDGRVRFLLAGSIGLDAVVTRVGMSGTVNDLVPFRLGPLDRDQAESLLVELGKGEGLELEEPIRERILHHVSWRIPYHLQLMVDQLLRRVIFGGETLEVDLVDRAYESLFSSENRKQFSHWEERLRDEILTSAERELMTAILSAAARDPEGVSRDSVIQLRRAVAPKVDADAVLLSLENDGYLVHHADRWRFPSSLLRTWWLRWHVEKREDGDD